MSGKREEEGRSCGVGGPETGPLLAPSWMGTVGPSRGSAVASVSGVGSGGEGPLGWVSQLLPHPTPVLIGIPHGERQKHNQKCSSKKKDTMVLGRLFRLEHFQLGSRHIEGPPFPQLASGRPPSLTRLSSEPSSHHHVTEPWPLSPHPQGPPAMRLRTLHFPQGLRCPGRDVGLYPQRVLAAGIFEAGAMTAHGVHRVSGQIG